MVYFPDEAGEFHPPATAYRQAGSSWSGEVDESSFYIFP
jgi:hypothetical protein